MEKSVLARVFAYQKNATMLYRSLKEAGFKVSDRSESSGPIGTENEIVCFFVELDNDHALLDIEKKIDNSLFFNPKMVRGRLETFTYHVLT